MKVYEFDHFKDFFEHQLREKSVGRAGQPKTTLQSLAKKLGYNSPSSLSMILSGERLPSKTLLESLFNEWNLSATECERIRLKVGIEKSRRKGETPIHLISQFNHLAPYHKIDLNQYKLVRDWYVLVIKIMAAAPDFNEDPAAISLKLRKKITPSQAKKALELLIETGYLDRDASTGKIKPKVNLTETTHDIPSEAIRENHRGMLKRATEALDEQDLLQRHFNSLALQFDGKRIPEAKKKILDFVKSFNQEFHADEAEQVYQLNVQFFEHSNGGNKNDL